MNPSLRFDFQCDVLEQSHDMPVLVDFWAEGCAPCSLLAPVLQRLAEKHAGRFSLVKINTEEYPDIATKFQIRSIPTVLLFSAGEVTDSFSGALPEYQIEEWLKKTFPVPMQRRLLLPESLCETASAQWLFRFLMGLCRKKREMLLFMRCLQS